MTTGATLGPMIGHSPENVADKSFVGKSLRRRRVAALYSDARLIRAYPAGDDRTQQAERVIREAMYEQALGRLSVLERDRIIQVLSFAVEGMRLPPDEQACE